MSATHLKVGELAVRTGLTIRTLHHYDEIGLVKPSGLTGSGHRLYGEAEVARLQAVLSLRELGLSLEEIAACLDRTGFSPLEVIERHASRLRERIARQRDLCTRLEGLSRFIRQSGEPVPTGALLETIEVMTMIESYYTPEQLEQLRRRAEATGPEAIRRAEQEWPVLISRMKAHMRAGTDPADPVVQALAARWRELVGAFTGGDPGIRQSLDRLWKEQGETLSQQRDMGLDAGLMSYVEQAHAVARSRPG